MLKSVTDSNLKYDRASGKGSIDFNLPENNLINTGSLRTTLERSVNEDSFLLSHKGEILYVLDRDRVKIGNNTNAGEFFARKVAQTELSSKLADLIPKDQMDDAMRKLSKILEGPWIKQFNDKVLKKILNKIK